MFNSLDIEQFRGFAELSLGDLGRVNLIVGKNNTGKTSLLEALTLVADPGMLPSMPSLFRAGNGAAYEGFYRWLPREGAPDASANIRAVTSRGERRVVVTTNTRLRREFTDNFDLLAHVPGCFVYILKNVEALRLRAVSVQHGSPEAMVDPFADAIRAPEDEQQMESLLHAVDPRVRTVRAVASKPFIAVDVGLRERIPISQAGQGVYRLVAIFSELLSHKPDACLIDEVENGIHYTALPTLWNGIAVVSARLGVQVFATTHSRECLVAAHETFAARESYDLRVIQLYRVGDEMTGRTLDRKHIEAAIAGDIELR
jgi:AAA15 family ATPase/GTPase